MADPADPLMSGAFAPLLAEYDLEDLRTEGAWPADLDGVLYRVGPNPRFPPLGPYNPLQGEGMIHAFTLRGGHIAYRNRWVRTRRWRLEDAAGRALFATGDSRLNDPSVAGVDGQGAANTHVIAHGGRLLALEEGHPPIAIDPRTLETLGPHDFGGALAGPMTAHPKTDPVTGDLVFFTNFPDRRFDGALRLHVADRTGALVRTEQVPGPYPALVHDFAITQRHIVFVLSPATLSLERLRAGAPPVAWEPERGGFVGLTRRDGGGANVRWFPAPAAMVWHTLNAFDDGETVVVDLCQQAAAAFPTPDGRPPAPDQLQQRLARWIVRPDHAVPVSVHELSPVACEYPRIDERRIGLAYRYGFVAAEGGPGTGDLSHRAIGRFDHRTGRMDLWRAPRGRSVSEPVFVPRSPDADEGVGHILTIVHDEASDASHLALLDAERLEAGPIARAFLDHRVPAGFHGSFVPGRA